MLMIVVAVAALLSSAAAWYLRLSEIEQRAALLTGAILLPIILPSVAALILAEALERKMKSRHAPKDRLHPDRESSNGSFTTVQAPNELDTFLVV
jgi:hypothetical protein